jgi:hypothetical protein
MSLKNKVAIVTGASMSFSRSAYADAGTSVHAADLQKDVGEDPPQGRQRRQLTICGVESAWHHDKAASRITRLRGDNVFDLIL